MVSTLPLWEPSAICASYENATMGVSRSWITDVAPRDFASLLLMLPAPVELVLVLRGLRCFAARTGWCSVLEIPERVRGVGHTLLHGLALVLLDRILRDTSLVAFGLLGLGLGISL